MYAQINYSSNLKPIESYDLVRGKSKAYNKISYRNLTKQYSI